MFDLSCTQERRFSCHNHSLAVIIRKFHNLTVDLKCANRYKCFSVSSSLLLFFFHKIKISVARNEMHDIADAAQSWWPPIVLSRNWCISVISSYYFIINCYQLDVSEALVLLHFVHMHTKRRTYASYYLNKII